MAYYVEQITPTMHTVVCNAEVPVRAIQGPYRTIGDATTAIAQQTGGRVDEGDWQIWETD